MISQMGECVIGNIECTYSIFEKNINLIPKNTQYLSMVYEILRDIDCKVVKISKLGNENIYDYIYYSEVNLCFSGKGIIAKINTIIEWFANEFVSEIEIQSEMLGYYYSPAEIYYNERKKDIYIVNDLLYDSRIVHNFIFKYKGFDVEVIMKFGDMLSRGICSRLNLIGSIVLKFKKSSDHNLFFDLIKDTLRCLKFAMYTSDLSIVNIDLITYKNNNKSICGRVMLMDSPTKYLHYSASSSNFCYIKPYMSNFFRIVCNDRDLVTGHIGDKYIIDENVYVKIFAAFENEYNRLPENIRLKDTTSIEDFRMLLIDKINNVSVDDEAEKQFLQEVICNVKRIGNEYGLRKKILVVSNYIKDTMASTRDLFKINEDKLKSIASEVPMFRSKIVHTNYTGKIGESINILYVEWMTYAMMLFRCNVPHDTIELILGRMFLCNAKDIDKRL